MFAPALKSVLASFGSTSETMGAFLLTIFVTGYASGPLLWAPLCELYGRRLITKITIVFSCARMLRRRLRPRCR